MRSILVGLLGASCILLTLSCSTNSPTGPKVTTVKITPDTLRMSPGQTLGLLAFAEDANGQPVAGAAISWVSADTTVATVSALAVVHAKKGGNTTLTASADGIAAQVDVIVKAVAASVSLTPADTAIHKGGSYQLTAVVYDSTHGVISGAPVTFGSSDTTVATVSATGLVTAIGGGTSALTATSGTAVGYATIAVIDSSIEARTFLSGGPFGAATTAGGTVYVLRYQVDSGSRFNLPGASVVASFGLAGVPTGVTFDSGGATAYVTDQFSDEVQVVAVGSNSVTDSIPVHGNPAVVRVSPDDKSIWVSTTLDSVFQIDRTTKAVLAAYGMPGVPNGLAFNPANDSMLYVSTSDAGDVIEVNYRRNAIGRTFSPGGKTQGIAVSPDGSTLYVANESQNEIETYNLVTGTAGSVAAANGGAFDLQLSADGTKIWVTLSSSGKVEAFDRSTLAPLQTINTGGTPRRMAIAGSNPVVVANEGGWVDFFKP